MFHVKHQLLTQKEIFIILIFMFQNKIKLLNVPRETLLSTFLSKIVYFSEKNSK